jgi:uncharacterized protein (UPF0262 family)
MTEAAASHRLARVNIDETSLAASSPEQEHERQVAIFDLLEANVFHPDEAGAGPFSLDLSLAENRLCLDVAGPPNPQGPAFAKRYLLSLSPFRGIIKDYFLVCESYYDAIRTATAGHIEALDMGRRGLHDEGAGVLRERLQGKITVDKDTARRLFTLICALHRRGTV